MVEIEKFDLNAYNPIDYNKWVVGDEARAGANILHLLNEKERTIWDRAIPFQDQRNDPGQGEMVTYFAIQLLKYMEGNREIVVPAAILHDIGWYGADLEEWRRLVEKLGDPQGEIRRPHQNRGVGIAGCIYGQLGYSVNDNILSVFDIIGDHDTRLLGPTPENEALIVRDADLLWRVTYPVVLLYMKDHTIDQVIDNFEKNALVRDPPHNLGPLAERIAKVEVVNTLIQKFGDEACVFLRNRDLDGEEDLAILKKFGIRLK